MAPDSAVSADLFFEENGLFEALLARLPDDARGSLTEAQLAAFRVAAQKCKWGDHAVNIRLSIPLLLSRYYMVVVCGYERRGKARRAAERKLHPLRTLINSLFLGGVVSILVYCIVLAATWAFIALSSYCG